MSKDKFLGFTSSIIKNSEDDAQIYPLFIVKIVFNAMKNY
jgi:hypothetical protein